MINRFLPKHAHLWVKRSGGRESKSLIFCEFGEHQWLLFWGLLSSKNPMLSYLMNVLVSLALLAHSYLCNLLERSWLLCGL